jgi:hypothetical protein
MDFIDFVTRGMGNSRYCANIGGGVGGEVPEARSGRLRESSFL